MKLRGKLGDVMHRSPSSGNLIVKLETETRIGDPVFDPKGRRVGTVFDIFGPVEAPFAAIKTRGEPEDPDPKAVFLGEGRREEKPRDRSRRRRRRG